MKTLYEGILDDMEVALNAGDKYDKQYKAAEKELNVIKSLCSDIKNWHGGEFERGDRHSDIRGISYEYQILVNCPNLAKVFSLPAKKLYITIRFVPRVHIGWVWYACFEFTNAHKMIQNPNFELLTFIKSFKQKFEYSYFESRFIQDEDKRSRFTPKEFIDKYVISNFTDMNTFEKEIVNVSHELTRHNCPVKYFAARPI